MQTGAWHEILAASKRGDDECWPWAGFVHSIGYAYVVERGKRTTAHRAVYRLYGGVLRRGSHIDHLCRNRACVNPRHLEQVDVKTNILRGESFSAHNARKSSCKHDHDLTDPDAYWLKQYGPRCTQRICKECKRRRNRQDYHRREDRKKLASHS